jgi:hypothetical protein
MDHLILIIWLLVVLLTAIYLIVPSDAELFGRPVWHEPREIIDYESDGKGTSQQVLDIYSFSHITHGVLLYFLLRFLGLGVNNGLYVAILMVVMWEIFENTPFIINRYRRNKEYEHYKGDSIANIIGDIILVIFGYYLSYKTPTLAILYAALSEIVLMCYEASVIHLSFGSLF